MSRRDKCCNHDCNQGRDCPARAAKVAKVNRRSPAAKPLPPSAWQRQMRHLAKWLLIVLAVMTITPALLSVALAHAMKPPPSKCQELLAKKFVPASVRIKCKGAV